MDPTTIVLAALVAQAIGFALICWTGAQAKGLEGATWAILGLLFGPMAFLAVLVARNRRLEAQLERIARGLERPRGPAQVEAGGQARPAPAPRGRTKPPEHAPKAEEPAGEWYRGMRIVRTASGYAADGKDFPSMAAAQRHIDGV